MRRILLLGMLMLLSFPVTGAAQDRDGALETLLGVRVGPRGIAFAVVSSGCTEKRDFRVEILGPPRDVGTGEDPLRVALIREEFDPCLVVPFRVVIRFSFRELDLARPQPLLLVNTIDPGRLDSEPPPPR